MLLEPAQHPDVGKATGTAASEGEPDLSATVCVAVFVPSTSDEPAVRGPGRTRSLLGEGARSIDRENPGRECGRGEGAAASNGHD